MTSEFPGLWPHGADGRPNRSEQMKNMAKATLSAIGITYFPTSRQATKRRKQAMMSRNGLTVGLLVLCQVPTTTMSINIAEASETEKTGMRPARAIAMVEATLLEYLRIGDYLEVGSVHTRSLTSQRKPLR